MWERGRGVDGRIVKQERKEEKGKYAKRKKKVGGLEGVTKGYTSKNQTV